jgi:hypothetical protein
MGVPEACPAFFNRRTRHARPALSRSLICLSAKMTDEAASHSAFAGIARYLNRSAIETIKRAASLVTSVIEISI